MKSNRQKEILDLISRYPIDTQEELINRLSDVGYKVTQATVSRDVKELKIIKTLSENGKYIYTVPLREKEEKISQKFQSIFSEGVISVDQAQHLVVIKCYTGMAHAVCATLDAISLENIIGTLAGDDTIFIAAKDEANASKIVYILKKYLN